MIEIIKNKENLKEIDITEEVIRVKALIINSSGNVLLGYSHCEYQFPGGHVKENEELLHALKRELKEETGLIYEVDDIKPFAVLKSYHKDYPTKCKNRKDIIYYYEIKDDRIPDIKSTNYTFEELDGNYKLRYIPLNIVSDVIKDNMDVCGDVAGVQSEMLELLNLYKIN